MMDGLVSPALVTVLELTKRHDNWLFKLGLTVRSHEMMGLVLVAPRQSIRIGFNNCHHVAGPNYQTMGMPLALA